MDAQLKGDQRIHHSKQREAFRKQLWQLSDLEVSSSSVSSFPAPPEKPELEANKRQRSAPAGGFQEAGT